MVLRVDVGCAEKGEIGRGGFGVVRKVNVPVICTDSWVARIDAFLSFWVPH